MLFSRNSPKKGGIISGHDYCTIGRSPYGLRVCRVKDAVNVCTRVLGVKNLYILGDLKPKKGDKRDKTRSWLFIKE